jgi:SAM-dependent methyltransferase
MPDPNQATVNSPPAAFREADIRPADLHAEYLRLSAEDAQRLLRKFPQTQHRFCPACGADRAVRRFTKNGFDLGDCAKCGTLYALTCPAPEALAELYRDSPSAAYWAGTFFPAVAEARREKIFRPRAAAMLDIARRHGVKPRRIMDVGAGAGILLDEIHAMEPQAELVAVEPGATLAETCRRRGLSVFQGFAEDAAQQGLADTADLVLSSEVIEHAPDPIGFLAALGRLARPGGLVLVTGLFGSGFDIATLREKSNAVAPPHHLNFPSRRGVRSMIARAGLEELEFLTPGKLDVDIVVNALASDPRATADSFARNLAIHADEKTRAAFQEFLSAQCMSSHMWIVARRS